MNEQLNFYQHKLAYEIDSWDLFEAVSRGEKIVIIDARSKEAYELEHIPELISLPHRKMSEFSTKDFDREYLYVTYCDCIGCNASTKGALNMVKLGFKVIGGLDWWKRDGYETHGVKGAEGNQLTCGC